MGKKSTPKAPTPPDPVATANAQAAANRESAIAQANLNRIDQYTPQGSVTYTQIGTNSDGTPRFSSTQKYSPDEQAKYDQQNQIAIALGALAGDNISRVNTAQATPFSYDGMTPIRTQVGQGQPGLQYGATPGAIRNTIGDSGQVQTGLDFSGATKLPGTEDFGAEARRVQDAVYQQATSRLDPRFQQGESDIRSRLAAQGISENSDAYRRELDNFGREKTDAYNQAQFSGIQAGANEQSRLFGLALNARQQGVGETAQQGQFANNAQDQRFQQNLTGTELFNNAQNQQFTQGQQQVATNNQARAQGFNEDVTNANFNNTARQQQIQEATYLRNLPLNEIAALLGTGGGVANPDFVNVSQVGVAAPDYQGAVYANYNAANQQYQQAMQARSAGLGSIFGLAGSLGSAIISDIRLKHSIKRVGQLANGIATYVFSYIGDAARHFGVMAQDVVTVRPDAVISAPNGYLAVDYRKVW